MLHLKNIYVAVGLSPRIYPLFSKGSWVQSSATSSFFFLFSRFSLIPSQSASLYIIASFEVYLIDENNHPHVLVVLFQKSSTVQYILTPSIFDMPLLYSISSQKSMTDMHGSSNFRLSGGGGGGQNLTEKGFVNFLVLKLVSSITQPK